MFSCGVVITTCEGREDNLKRTVDCLKLLEFLPEEVVVVFDGCDSSTYFGDAPFELTRVPIEKHRPGLEQPRNVGVRSLTPGFDAVWFLDSDLVFGPDCLTEFMHAWNDGPPRILIGRYDWLAPGEKTPYGRLELTDPRAASFEEHEASDVLIGDLGAALACFGGNLVWPVREFHTVGGFHPQLHHGRCEDGELGLRAAAQGIPMSLVGGARAWHVWHPRDVGAILEKNKRDVPLLNTWHPWVEAKGLVVSSEDGARFDFVCPDCGETVNSLEYWSHTSEHR